MRRASILVALVAWIAFGLPSADAVTLPGTDNPDAIFGTAAADNLFGGLSGDTLFGKENPNKRRRKGKKPKKVFDRLDGGAGADQLLGGSGRDILIGGASPDIDLLFDGDGTSGDQLLPGDGGDFVVAADGAADVISCGPGSDEVIADPIDTTSGCEHVVAGSFNDVPFFGSIVRDFIFGTAGDDAALSGSDGANDIVFGLAGNDTIALGAAPNLNIADGGSGIDTLTGGDDNDTLIDDDGIAGDTLQGGDDSDNFLAADGAVTTIDCGGPAMVGDGDTDNIFRDPEDVLAANCVGETVRVGEGVVTA
jgi:Ca2+-binding RTX toxin-like protein